MKTRTCVWVSGALALLFAAEAAASTAEVVEVEGVAAVINDDIAHARDRAIDDARRKAVEQVAGAQVSAESITQSFQLVEDRIYARASGFVKNYQILSELKDEGVYRVKVKATVDRGAVAENLEQIFRVKPRVIVLIAEQNVGSKSPDYWWGNAGFASDMNLMQTSLIEEWQPKGYKFIDPGLLSGKLKVQGAMRNPALSDEAAVTLSRSADADIALVGKVLVTDAGPVMEGVKMRSFHAVATLRVLNVDTGEIVAVADETAVAPHIDANVGGRAAIKALGKKLSSGLEQKIMARWTTEAAGARELELVVKGAKTPKDLKEVERVLREEVRGVESVQVRRKHKGATYLTVRVRASAADLASDLEAKSFACSSRAPKTLSRATMQV